MPVSCRFHARPRRPALRAVCHALLTVGIAGHHLSAQSVPAWSLSVGVTVAAPKSHVFQGATGVTGGISRTLVGTPFGAIGIGLTADYFKSEAGLVCPAQSSEPCDTRRLAGFVQAGVSVERGFTGMPGFEPFVHAGVGVWTGRDSGTFAGQASSEGGVAGSAEVGAQTGPIQTGLGYRWLDGTRHGHAGLASIVVRVRV